MHQQEYIIYLLKEHGLHQCNPVSLSMDPVFSFGQDTDIYPQINNLLSKYCKLMGELLYLTMYTCPDIALAIMKLSQHNAHPKPHHYTATKQVLHYLFSTLSYCVHYRGKNTDITIHGFSDADWATSPEDYVSITGYVWYYYSSPISHAAKKQATQALSSAEAEYMVLTGAIQDGLWIKSFYSVYSPSQILC